MRIFHNGVKSSDCKRDMPKSLQEEYEKEADRQDKRIDELYDEVDKLKDQIIKKDKKISTLSRALEVGNFFEKVKPEVKSLKDKLLYNKNQAVLDKIAQIEVRLEENSKKGKIGWFSSPYDDDYIFISDNIEYIARYFKTEGIEVLYGSEVGSAIEFLPDD